MTYDAIVIGARAAGSPTAMLLARKGYKVALIDRDDFPSDTISTHLLHVSGIAALNRWGLYEKFVAAVDAPPIRRATFDFGGFEVTGRVPEVGGVNATYSPRRYLLDKMLVDAAKESGVNVFTGINIRDVVQDEAGVVIGVTGYDRDGIPVQFDGTIVIGADGMNSRIARIVEAKEYRQEDAASACYYGYWDGIPQNDVRIYISEGQIVGEQPTSEGQTVVFVQIPRAEMDTFKKDIPGNFFKALSRHPELAARIARGRQVERFVGTGDVRGFFRVPFGPGWALVGDAGYHRDPTLGHGIMDAFYQAEILVEALDDAFQGRLSFESSLAVYQQQRDLHHSADYDLVTSMANIENPPPAEVVAVMEALSRNPEAADQYISMISGVLPVAEFFDPANIGRIMSQSVLAQAA